MKKFSTSFRGYSKEEVNDFVGQVTKKYESMLNNLKQKDEQIVKLNDKLKYYNQMQTTLNSAVTIAENTSAQLKKIARDESNNIIKEAKLNASKIVNDALVRSNQIEQQTIEMKHRAKVLKSRLKKALEEELSMLDDIDNIDY